MAAQIAEIPKPVEVESALQERDDPAKSPFAALALAVLQTRAFGTLATPCHSRGNTL